MRCQRDNSNEDPSWRQKELIPRCQRKQRGIPEKESPGISNPKEDPSWHQKEVIPRCQRYNSNENLSWRQKELITKCQRENFAPTEFKIQIWVFNFGRGVEYSNI